MELGSLGGHWGGRLCASVDCCTHDVVVVADDAVADDNVVRLD